MPIVAEKLGRGFIDGACADRVTSVEEQEAVRAGPGLSGS